MSKDQPQFHPISMLPVFTEMMDGMLEASTDQLRNMHRVVHKPHVLDDETLNGVIEQYSVQLGDHWLFEEQFARWKRSGLTPAQEREVDRLIAQSIKLQATNEEILKLARSIEHSTINKIMEMDEIELLDALVSGKIKPPQ